MRPGKPTENGLIESFYGRLRDECPNVNEFAALDDVRAALRSWQHDITTIFRTDHLAI